MVEFLKRLIRNSWLAFKFLVVMSIAAVAIPLTLLATPFILAKQARSFWPIIFYPFSLIFGIIAGAVHTTIMLYKLYNAGAKAFKAQPPISEEIPTADTEYTYRPESKSIYEKTMDMGRSVLKYALFPLYMVGMAVKKIVMDIAFPSDFDSQHIVPGLENRISKEYNKKIISINMPDNVKLHTCEYSLKNSTENDATETCDHSKPHIIYFGGNMVRYEDYLSGMIDDAKNYNAKVIGFHHSFYGKSGKMMPDGTLRHITVTSTSILVEEGIAQVHRLLDNNVPANNITLYGHSMGGAIATLVAAHFNERNIPVKIFNDRAFSNCTDYVMGKFEPKAKKFSFISHLVRPIVEVILKLTDWNLDAGKAFHKIPKENRQYTVARNKNDAMPDYENREQLNTYTIASDDIIPYAASIHRVPEIRQERKAAKKNVPIVKIESSSVMPSGDCHKFFLKSGITKHFYVQREYEKPRGEYYTATETRSLNNAERSELQNKAGKTAEEFFGDFVQSKPH